jgi:hypothetical protein
LGFAAGVERLGCRDNDVIQAATKDRRVIGIFPGFGAQINQDF